MVSRMRVLLTTLPSSETAAIPCTMKCNSAPNVLSNDLAMARVWPGLIARTQQRALQASPAGRLDHPALEAVAGPEQVRGPPGKDSHGHTAVLWGPRDQ